MHRTQHASILFLPPQTARAYNPRYSSHVHGMPTMWRPLAPVGRLLLPRDFPLSLKGHVTKVQIRLAKNHAAQTTASADSVSVVSSLCAARSTWSNLGEHSIDIDDYMAPPVPSADSTISSMTMFLADDSSLPSDDSSLPSDRYIAQAFNPIDLTGSDSDVSTFQVEVPPLPLIIDLATSDSDCDSLT